MIQNTSIFTSRDAVNETREHLDAKKTKLNNLVTSDQTNMRRKTEFDFEQVDATKCEVVGSRQVGFC